MSGRGREGCRLKDGSACEVVVENGLAVGFEDRLCGHFEGRRFKDSLNCETVSFELERNG